MFRNLSKRGIPRLLIEKIIELIKDETSLKNREKTETIADSFRTDSLCKSVETDFDEEHGTYYIDLEYEQNGVVLNKSINWDFLTGPEFTEVNAAHETLRQYPQPPYMLSLDKNTYQIESQDELVTFLFEKIKKGLYVQRYKGLGEMNPNQLWETTMDPTNRTLLQVNINDYFESEKLFDTLMGSDSTKRKEFIVENALHVKNLDI